MRKSCVTHATLPKIESDVVVKPGVQTVAKIAKALGVSSWVQASYAGPLCQDTWNLKFQVESSLLLVISSFTLSEWQGEAQSLYSSSDLVTRTQNTPGLASDSLTIDAVAHGYRNPCRYPHRFGSGVASHTR